MSISLTLKKKLHIQILNLLFLGFTVLSLAIVTLLFVKTLITSNLGAALVCGLPSFFCFDILFLGFTGFILHLEHLPHDYSPFSNAINIETLASWAKLLQFGKQLLNSLSSRQVDSPYLPS